MELFCNKFNMVRVFDGKYWIWIVTDWLEESFKDGEDAFPVLYSATKEKLLLLYEDEYHWYPDFCNFPYHIFPEAVNEKTVYNTGAFLTPVMIKQTEKSAEGTPLWFWKVLSFEGDTYDYEGNYLEVTEAASTKEDLIQKSED